MKYKAIKHINNSKKNESVKDAPIYKARSFNDIRFREVFMESKWLQAGPRRFINICTQANDYLWPVRGRIYHDRKLDAFVWIDYVDMKSYRIKYDGSLCKEL